MGFKYSFSPKGETKENSNRQQEFTYLLHKQKS